MRVDLNADMGEVRELHESGLQRRLLQFVTSVNISCGAHAGDPELIRATVLDALAAGVRIGAHPGFPDRENFGRVRLEMGFGDLVDEVERQVRSFSEMVESVGGVVTHVKAHGALYNVAAKERDVAEAICEGVARWRSGGVVLVGLAGSVMLEVFASRGFPVWREGFADRRYEADGSLRSRTVGGAVIGDPQEAAEQAWRLAGSGGVDTICIHSDHPGSDRIAEAVWRKLGFSEA